MFIQVHVKNKDTQDVQEFFFFERDKALGGKVLAALRGLLTVMLWLIQQVCLVTMYSEKKIKPTYLLLTKFEVCTVSYGPSFFCSDLWPKRKVRGP